MKKRILFTSKEARDLFFQKVLESQGLIKFRELREYFNIPKSLLEFYRTGRLTLPQDLYDSLTKKFNKPDKQFFLHKIEILDSNWGSVKAGKATYSKHKEIFDAGRKKAIKAIQKKVDKFDINMPLTGELAHFIGLFIGDGFTNKYYTHYIVQFVGDSRYEKEFYKKISKYSQRAFKVSSITKDSNFGNWFRFNLYSKNLFKMITQRFKISAGRKSRNVLIPDEILNSNPEIVKSCLRGLYDAEGCVFFDKREFYKKPYPRVELHMCNLAILQQVSDILNQFKIPNVVGKSEKNFRVTVWGPENVKKFVNAIGFSNPKQLDKLKNL